MERFFDAHQLPSKFEWRSKETDLAIVDGDRRVTAVRGPARSGKCSFLTHNVSVAEGETQDVAAFATAIELWLYGHASSGDLVATHPFLTQTPAARPLECGRYTEWLWQQDATFGARWMPWVVVARSRPRLTRFHPFVSSRYPLAITFPRRLDGCHVSIELHRDSTYCIYVGYGGSIRNAPLHAGLDPAECCDRLEVILDAS